MITSGVFLTFLIFMPSAKNKKKNRNLEEGLLAAEKCHTNLASYTVDLKENNQNTLSSIRWQDTSWPRLLKRTRSMQSENCETNDDTLYLVKYQVEQVPRSFGCKWSFFYPIERSRAELSRWLLRVTNFLFLLTISPLIQPLRSWEYKKWSQTKRSCWLLKRVSFPAPWEMNGEQCKEYAYRC